jgi:hypothetical protein
VNPDGCDRDPDTYRAQRSRGVVHVSDANREHAGAGSGHRPGPNGTLILGNTLPGTPLAKAPPGSDFANQNPKDRQSAVS